MADQEHCAWCIREQGETPKETDSHGVCKPHAEQIMIDYYARKFEHVPSYVETQAAKFAAERKSA